MTENRLPTSVRVILAAVVFPIFLLLLLLLLLISTLTCYPPPPPTDVTEIYCFHENKALVHSKPAGKHLALN